MSLSDDELREQLERRTSPPLAPVERSNIIESVHSRSGKRRTSWFVRLAIPLAAAATVLVFVVIVGFPRAPQTSSASPTPGSTPAASSAGTPSPSATAIASASPQSGLAVLSADQLIALAGDPSKVGEVVVSDAVISFVPSPTQFDVPDASPQPFGTIEAGGGSVVVIGQSFPDTSWPDHAFRVVEGGRVEYLGAVNDSKDDGVWTVADAVTAAPPEADSLLYAVSGWLLDTPPVPCPAPPDFSSQQDYWCGGSWLLPDKPAPPTDGTIHLQYPGAIHAQWSAYSDFAPDPQSNGGLGSDPRLGTYLVRPAGCPPNVMGDCPVWEMVGRLESPATGTSVTPAPTATAPTATPEPTVSPTPVAPAPSYPADWPASLTDALAERSILSTQFAPDGSGQIFVAEWPFTNPYPVEQHYPDTAVSGTAGHEAVVLHKAAQDIEVMLVSGLTGESRVIGHFPLSDEWSADVSLDGREVFVHGSSGDVNDPQAAYVDHGIVAWDVETGASRTVLAPSLHTATRWDIHVSPDNSTVASGRSAQDGSFAYDVVAPDGSVHAIQPLSNNLTIDAITNRYGIGFAPAFDPSIGTALERHVLVDLRDGSQRLVPAKADSLIDSCETCLSVGVGPSWVVDDNHFLLIRSKLWLLDANNNVARAVYDLAGTGLEPYGWNPVLSSEWFLLTPSAYGDPVDLKALNLTDGQLIDVGAVQPPL